MKPKAKAGNSKATKMEVGAGDEESGEEDDEESDDEEEDDDDEVRQIGGLKHYKILFLKHSLKNYRKQ